MRMYFISWRKTRKLNSKTLPTNKLSGSTLLIHWFTRFITLKPDIYFVRGFEDFSHQDLRLVEVKINYMMLTVAKQGYALRLVFTLNAGEITKTKKKKTNRWLWFQEKTCWWLETKAFSTWFIKTKNKKK